jgi:hypothetical protein
VQGRQAEQNGKLTRVIFYQDHRGWGGDLGSTLRGRKGFAESVA